LPSSDSGFIQTSIFGAKYSLQDWEGSLLHKNYFTILYHVVLPVLFHHIISCGVACIDLKNLNTKTQITGLVLTKPNTSSAFRLSQ